MQEAMMAAYSAIAEVERSVAFEALESIGTDLPDSRPSRLLQVTGHLFDKVRAGCQGGMAVE